MTNYKYKYQNYKKIFKNTYWWKQNHTKYFIIMKSWNRWNIYKMERSPIKRVCVQLCTKNHIFASIIISNNKVIIVNNKYKI